jgi:hypothetical protein
MLKCKKEQTLVFNEAFNGFNPLILLKIIKNDKHIQTREIPSKINGVLGFKRAEKQ